MDEYPGKEHAAGYQKREANWPTNAATRNKEKRWQQQNRTNLLFYKRFLSQYEVTNGP